MKVKTLELRRFLAWPRLRLELPERVSVFVGPNGAGKSSILDAVRVLLTKTARGVAKGEVARLTTWGESKGFRVQALVGLVQDGEFLGSTIRRTASRVAVIDDEGTAIEITEGALVEKLTRHPKAVDAVFDVWKALRMTPEERRALILDLGGEHVLEVTEDRLKEFGLSTPAIRTEALAGRWKKAAALAANTRRSTQANLDALDLRAVDVPQVGEGDGLAASEVDDGILENQRQALAELRERRRQLDERIGAAKAARSSVAPDPDPDPDPAPSRPERETVQARIDELTRQIDEADAEALVRDGAEATNRISNLTPKASAAAEHAKRMEANAVGLETIATEASKRLGRAEKMKTPHECPECGLRHEHPEAPDLETMQRLEKEVADAEDMARKKRAEADERNRRAAELQKDLEEAGRELARVKEGLDQLDQLAKDRNRERTKLADLDAPATPVATAAAAPPADDVEQLQEEREQLQARIDRGSTMIRQVDEYREAARQLQERQAKARRLRQRIEDLQAEEDLCRPDKPGNIPARLLEPVLGPIRERLGRWSGSPLWTSEAGRDGVQIDGVDLDDDFAPVVVATDGARYPIDTVNASAEWRVGFALAAALADLSGLRFLALDEVTYLDGANRSGLLGALLEVGDLFDQVLVCAVQSGQVVQPNVDAVRFYGVEPDGVVSLADGECWPPSQEDDE